MKYIQLLDAVTEEMDKYPEYREGQAFINVLRSDYPNIYKDITYPNPLDTFYDSKKIFSALKYILNNFEWEDIDVIKNRFVRVDYVSCEGNERWMILKVPEEMHTQVIEQRIKKGGYDDAPATIILIYDVEDTEDYSYEVEW